MGSEHCKGWTNSETQAVAAWIDDQEARHLYWLDVARECVEGAGDAPPFTPKQRAVLALAKRLKAEVEEARPPLEAPASQALSGVNWSEIATRWIDDVYEGVVGTWPPPESD